MSGRRISMIVAALVVGATLVAGAMAAGQGYKQVGKWGKVGTGNGQFGNGVFGLATSKGGNVYAADTSNNRIQVFTAKGGFVDKFGALGAGNGQFSGPSDVAIAPDGSVFVADYSNDRVEKLSAGGGFQQAIDVSQPTGVGVDADGNLYVADVGGEGDALRQGVELCRRQLVARRGERRRPRSLRRRNALRLRHGRAQGHTLLERGKGAGFDPWRPQQSDRHRGRSRLQRLGREHLGAADREVLASGEDARDCGLGGSGRPGHRGRSRRGRLRVRRLEQGDDPVRRGQVETGDGERPRDDHRCRVAPRRSRTR